MGSLVIFIEDSRLKTQKGSVTVDVRMLDAQNPIMGCYPIVGLNRRWDTYKHIESESIITLSDQSCHVDKCETLLAR
eukprot:scaffold61930_cov43-Prasinocladus_malaysianus.AAC.1